MKKYLSYFLFLLISFNCFSQIHLKNGAKIRINGGTSISPIFVVLNSPPSSPVVTSGTTGNGIIMEDEYNRLQYNLGSATTAITVPYMSGALEEIPLTLTPSTAGSGAGNIRFSAKVASTRSTGFDNLVYKPSDVTNMAALPNISNNSNKTIDRFWIIDANGYTTKPSVTLSFTYIDAEWATNGGNSITESELKAQRFNNTAGINDWEGTTAFPPAGTINTSANTVSGVTVTSANFYKSWTLNASSVPLPIELKDFNAVCKSEKVHITWTTISEINNDYFTLEKSMDGINYTEIAQIDGNGTSSFINSYSYTDEKFQSEVYYRLKQTDFNGDVEIFTPVSINCFANEHIISIQPNPNGGQFTLVGLKENNKVIISDLLGKIIYESTAQSDKMEIQLNEFSFGMYNVQVIDNDQSFVKKLIIE